MATVVANVPSGNPDVDALLTFARWNPFVLLRYGFPQNGGLTWTGYSGNSEPYQNYAPLNAAQQAVVTAIFQAVEQFANITFVNSTAVGEMPETATFRFGMTDEEEVAHAYVPNAQPVGGDVWLNRSSGIFNNPVRGDYAYSAIMHEIGHALGLLHPHDGDNFGTMSLTHDNMNYTVMTYRSYFGMGLEDPFPNGDFGFPQTFMMYDIAALQHMYGANFNSRSGSNVYRWDPVTGYLSIDGSVSVAPGANTVFMTIWDGGGIDTYDFSGYTNALLVNLIPGEWSVSASNQLADLGDGHRAIGNVANALLYQGDLRSLIENATGGVGDDQFIGNQAVNVLSGGGGADLLDGRGGADQLIGGSGNDRYVVDDSGDVVVEAFGDGDDSVDVSAVTYVLGANVERMTGVATTSAQDLTGNDSDNIISGNNLNGNRFTGGGGVDRITGGTGGDHILGGAGADILVSFEGSDIIEGGDGNDSINGGSEDDQLYGGTGDDSITGAEGSDLLVGESGADTLDAGNGADNLSGGGDADLLDGGGGDDVLNGGGGADQIFVGSGTDRVVYLSAGDSIDGAQDRIRQFESGVDKIDLSALTVSALSWTELNDPGDGTLYSLVTVATPGLAMKIRVDGHVALADFLVTLSSGATEGDDVINGTAGNDQIDALGGNDLLNLQQGGDDQVAGGSGNDDFSFGAAFTALDLVNGGAGLDRVLLAGDYSAGVALGVSTLAGVEQLILAAGFNYRLTTVDANVGPGLALRIDASQLGAANSLNFNGGAETDGGFELIGGAGNDQLIGGSGDDLLDGGAGADILRGGFGNDVYIVDNVNDSVLDVVNGGIDEIRTTLSTYMLTGGAENLTGLSSSGQTLLGSAFVNIIIGGSGDDVISGGLGADDHRGGAGNDIYFIDDVGDTITELDGEGIDEVRTNLTSYLLGATLENLTGLAFAGQNLTGNGLSNIITGGNFNDMLDGGAGSDHLSGGTGNDILDGGAGADQLAGGAGNDIYYLDDVGDGIMELAGQGTDEIRTLLATGSLFFLPDFENITGLGNVDQTLTGNSSDNVIDGGLGADTMSGGAGNDIYLVDHAGDSVSENGSEGIDEVRTVLATYALGTNLENLTGLGVVDQTLTGNGGDNMINGGGGADTMSGGFGNDIYVVDSFGDVVVENGGEGTDEIRTSLNGFNMLTTPNVERLIATTDDAHGFRGNAADNVIVGAGGADQLFIQDGGNDTVDGGGGNDIIYFGSTLDPVDRVDGGAGFRDVLVLQGNYNLTIPAATMDDIEFLSLQSGSITRFGDTAGNLYDYVITLTDASVNPGVHLVVNAQSLLAGEDLTFDGSDETDSTFFVYGGHGVDTLKGGAGADIFFFEGVRFGASDAVDGGGGRDSLVIAGVNGLNHIEFGETALTSIESISVNNRFATDPSAVPFYELVLRDGNVAANAAMTINASSLGAGQTVNVDAHLELDGSFTMFGGGGADVFVGGAKGDLLHGAGGADTLAGGAGGDTFQYRSIADSAIGSADRILDFTSGTDKIDLSFIDARTNLSGNQAFTFIGSGTFTGTAGELRAVFDAGNSWWNVSGDVDGDGIADFLIEVSTATADPISGADFIL